MGIGSVVEIRGGGVLQLEFKRGSVIGIAAAFPVVGNMYIVLLDQPLIDGTKGVVLPESLLWERTNE